MANSGNLHETLSRTEEVKLGSERSFGLVFAAFFSAIGLWPLLGGGAPRYWALGIAIVFLLLALAVPQVLKPLNVLWFRFGMLLSRFTNPIIMGILFVTTIVPIGLAMRAFGKQPLTLRIDPNAQSYWIPRDPPGPEPESLKNQF